MILKNYSLELVRLEKQFLEMLRQWRNAPVIVQHMEYKEYITPEMQLQWFDRVNNLNNFYFLIRFQETYLGLIHLSHIDFEKKEAQAGLFISDPKYLLTSFPVRASLILLDFTFNALGLDTVYAKVNNQNEKAIQYNKHLGFEHWKEAENLDFSWLILSKDNYSKSVSDLKKILEKIYGNDLRILFDRSDPFEIELESIVEKNMI